LEGLNSRADRDDKVGHIYKQHAHGPIQGYLLIFATLKSIGNTLLRLRYRSAASQDEKYSTIIRVEPNI
jgi:hypothetical protein